MDTKLVIGADHGGINLKQAVVEWLKKSGYEIEDLGTDKKESCDYPEFAFKVAERVAADKSLKGLLFCTTGVGMAVAANKVKGIRAALCQSEDQAEMARRHNDSNVLVLSEKYVTPGLAEKIVKIWLKTPFEGGRHERRVNKIVNYENGHFK